MNYDIYSMIKESFNIIISWQILIIILIIAFLLLTKDSGFISVIWLIITTRVDKCIKHNELKSPKKQFIRWIADKLYIIIIFISNISFFIFIPVFIFILHSSIFSHTYRMNVNLWQAIKLYFFISIIVTLLNNYLFNRIKPLDKVTNEKYALFISLMGILFYRLYSPDNIPLNIYINPYPGAGVIFFILFISIFLSLISEYIEKYKMASIGDPIICYLLTRMFKLSTIALLSIFPLVMYISYVRLSIMNIIR